MKSSRSLLVIHTYIYFGRNKGHRIEVSFFSYGRLDMGGNMVTYPTIHTYNFAKPDDVFGHNSTVE